MGHPPFDLLKTCYPSLFNGILVETLFCDSCHMAKLRRTTYKSLDDRCSVPLDCIHSDVWGPCSVESLTGCQYFIVFVDVAASIEDQGRSAEGYYPILRDDQ